MASFMKKIEKDFLTVLEQHDFQTASAYIKQHPYLLYEKYINLSKDTTITILHYATTFQSKAVLLYLLDNFAEINLTDSDLSTSLHYACEFGNLDIVTTLLTKKASLVLENSKGKNVLHLAAQHNHTEIVNVLLEAARSNPDIDFQNYIDSKTTLGETALHYAANNNNHRMLDLLLNNGVTTNTVMLGGIPPLHNSTVHCDQYPMTVKMIENGANVNTRGYDDGVTALFLAVKKNCTTTTKYLLQKGADHTLQELNYSYTPLHTAARTGYAQIIKLLLQYGARLDIAGKDGVLPIHLAAKSGSAQSVEYLLHYRANIESILEGFTPLLIAAKQGNYQTVNLLLNMGANSSYIHPDTGKGAVHIAAGRGHLDILKLLASKDVNLLYTLDHNYATIAHYAAANGQVDIINYLVDIGFALELRDKNGFTPIHMATLNNHQDTIKLLKDKGVDLNINTFFGLNLFELADILGNNQTTALLANTPKIQKTSSHWKEWFNMKEVFLYSLFCSGEKDDSELTNVAIETVMTELGKAAFDSGKEKLRYFSKDYCDLYKLRNQVNTLENTEIWIQQQNCSNKYTTSFIIENYAGEDFHVCKKETGNSYDFLYQLIPNTNILTVAGWFIVSKIYDFTTHSHQRISSFQGGVLTALGKDTPYGVGFYSFAPSLLLSTISVFQYMYYPNNANSAQYFIQQVASLDKKANFYLVERPSSCVSGDHLAYNLSTTDQVGYHVCEMANNYYDLSYIPEIMNMAFLLVPLTFSCFSLCSSNSPTIRANGLGLLSVGVAAAIYGVVADVFSEISSPIARYYANEYVNEHPEQKLYLVEKPAGCAENDALVYQTLYFAGSWLVCEDWLS